MVQNVARNMVRNEICLKQKKRKKFCLEVRERKLDLIIYTSIIALEIEFYDIRFVTCSSDDKQFIHM